MQVCAISPMTMRRWMPCRLSCEIQIGVGETAGAPMFAGDDFAGLRHELRAEFAAPGAELEALGFPRPPLDRRDVLPGFVVAGAVAVMHGIEDPKLRIARGMQNLLHVRNAIVGFGHGLDPWPDLAALGDEVVVGIDHEEGGDAPCRRKDVSWNSPLRRCRRGCQLFASAARSMLAANSGVSL